MSWLVDQSRERLKQGDFIGIGKIIAWSLRERYYERFYGISSSSPVPVEQLDTDNPTSEDYDPTSYLILRKTFRRLWRSGRNNDHGFLDVGCGKGRVTRVAATFPYRHIIGIELSQNLATIARHNLNRGRERYACRDIEILQADAASFDIPDTVGTVFMYNPFHGSTMDSFMRSLRDSFVRARRDITVVFVNPVQFEADRYPWLEATDLFHCFYPHYVHEMQVVMYSVVESSSECTPGRQAPAAGA
jgi:SAM-dependent methyltransferase